MYIQLKCILPSFLVLSYKKGSSYSYKKKSSSYCLKSLNVEIFISGTLKLSNFLESSLSFIYIGGGRFETIHSCVSRNA